MENKFLLGSNYYNNNYFVITVFALFYNFMEHSNLMFHKDFDNIYYTQNNNTIM